MTQDTMDRSGICAVVVTYFPTAECIRCLEALVSQVAEILIVDNGSSTESLRVIQPTITKLNLKLLRNSENLGIASALNSGLRYAQEHGYTWLATFDQDSVATPDMISRMLESLKSYGDFERVALVTPVHISKQIGTSYANRHCLARGDNWRIIRSAMTSGNLVRVSAAIDIGGFDADLFIDYVDHDFCMRLRRNGRLVLESSTAILWHSLGRTTRHKFLWKEPRTTNHSPTRRYYMTRNRIIMWRKHGRFDFRWALRDLKSFCYELAYIILWEKNRAQKVTAIARGFWDGARNVRGKLDAAGKLKSSS